MENSAYKVSDFPEPVVDVWDDNWDVINFFNDNSTQWRTGMNGPMGFDYQIVHHELDRKKIVGEEFDDFMADFRIVEAQALVRIHEVK